MSDTPEDLPPFFSSWPQMYAAVLAHLSLLILGCYLFDRYFG